MSPKTNAASILTCPAFDRFTGIRHGFSIRGVTPSDGAWPFPPAHSGEQVHGAQIACVSGTPGSDALRYGDNRIAGVDALITNSAETPIAVRSADCMPILLADSETGAIAAVHAGWRGTAKRILERTIDELQKNFGAKPENIYAALGPAIGPCCFKVRADVIDAFQKLGHPVSGYTQPKSEESWMLDLRGLNEHQLIEKGVPPLHIFTVGGCTACHPGDYPSYRRDGSSSERINAIIWKEGTSHARR